jgi:nucleotide-binding universal stress UspA family protein
MISSLVVATDGSASGERAVVVALDLARRFDATVHALSVVDTIDDGEGAGGDDATENGKGSDDGSADARRQRAERAVAAVAERADRGVHTAVEAGDPAAVIRMYAAETATDLIATGTRGRDGAHRFLLGSVAEEVVRTAPVPVLTVRQLETDD